MTELDKEHPFRTCCNEYSMEPSLLCGLVIDVDQKCVVCGKDQKGIRAYVDAGLIHCIQCALDHRHITEEDISK